MRTTIKIDGPTKPGVYTIDGDPVHEDAMFKLVITLPSGDQIESDWLPHNRCISMCDELESQLMQ